MNYFIEKKTNAQLQLPYYELNINVNVQLETTILSFNDYPNLIISLLLTSVVQVLPKIPRLFFRHSLHN